MASSSSSDSDLSSAAPSELLDVPHLGHIFTKKTFGKHVTCHHCNESMRLLSHGLSCKACHASIHERCVPSILFPCVSTSVKLMKRPVPHVWVAVKSFKKKCCNVCRKRLDDSSGFACQVCECHVHVDCMANALSQCKAYATYSSPETDSERLPVQHHVWREGNLSSGSKCVTCKKGCANSDILTGLRCDWCGITAHYGCESPSPQKCSFGSLGPIILPPNAVTLPRTRFSNGVLLGLEQLGYEIKPRSPSKSTTVPKEKEDRDILYVFDGNKAFRNEEYRALSLPKNTHYKDALTEALKAYGIRDDVRRYMWWRVGDAKGAEELLPHWFQENLSIEEMDRARKLASSALRADDLIVRLRDSECAQLQVFTDLLPSLECEPSHENFIKVSVSLSTDSEAVIQDSIGQLGLDGDSQKYMLSMVAINQGEKLVLSLRDHPLEHIYQTYRESVREGLLLRFYLELREDPHGEDIYVFVANLPLPLEDLDYKKALQAIVKPQNEWTDIHATYYEYGAIVLRFNSSVKACNAYEALNSTENLFPDKPQESPIYCTFLPKIQPHMIPETVVPLLVLVNPKSGGGQGQKLLRLFRKLLNPLQVYDLSKGGPLPGLHAFRNLSEYRVLACGGDGTVGWVLRCIDDVVQDSESYSPPVAVLPVGTGNDLARVLHWGPGLTGGESVFKILEDVMASEPIALDRWFVSLRQRVAKGDTESPDHSGGSACFTESNPKEDSSLTCVMTNYMGIGIDADMSLEFHIARQANPHKFSSRIKNKGEYFKAGIRKMVSGETKGLRSLVKVEVDGEPLVLNRTIEGLVLLNIHSWAAGANPWGLDKDDGYKEPEHNDGLLEVVGVTGVVHMGQMKSGLANGQRLAQARRVQITMMEGMPVHIDGEPWMQAASHVVVQKSALKATMLRRVNRSKTKMSKKPAETKQSAVATAPPYPAEEVDDGEVGVECPACHYDDDEEDVDDRLFLTDDSDAHSASPHQKPPDQFQLPPSPNTYSVSLGTQYM